MSDYSIATIRKEFRKQGLFYTPPALAELLKNLLPESPRRVYDPTCGRGNLLSVFDDSVEKYGQDIDASAVHDAQKTLVNFKGACGDVLANPAFIAERFDAIVANPPFSIAWQETRDGIFAFAPDVPSRSRADYAFLLHILWMLTDDGTAAVLNSPGIAYRGGREATIRRWMVEQNFIDSVIHIPENTFKDTAISTLCLVLKKNRTANTVHFIDKENTIDREVTLQEIAEKDYTLSVSAYLQKIDDKPKPDPKALETLARQHAIRRIRLEMQTSALVASLSGWNHLDFINDLRAEIDAHEEEFIKTNQAHGSALDNIATMELHEENDA